MDDPEWREDFHRRFEERIQRRNEEEARLRWFRYNSPSRRRLAEQYRRGGGDDELRDDEPGDG
ncbi:MAG: hypothetical protein KGK34_01115 [Chloroflexota bacterium]|nr:hypothetical protein [Chloroflexota bacterium]